MRVELRRSGGFAATTRTHAIVVDTARITAERAAAVDRAVAAARDCLADGGEAPPTKGADLLHYTVIIQRAPGESERGAEDEQLLSFYDPIPNPALAELVDLVAEVGEVQQ